MKTFTEALAIIQESKEQSWKEIDGLEIPWSDSTPAHITVDARINNGKLEVEFAGIIDDHGNEIHLKKEKEDSEEIIDKVLKKYREYIMKELQK